MIHTNFNYLYGLHAVHAALGNPKRRCHTLLTSRSLEPDMIKACADNNVPIEDTHPRDLSDICGEETVHQGVILKCAPLQPIHIEQVIAKTSDKVGIVVLDQVTDPHNVGAIIRSAAAFGITTLIQQDKNAPDPNNPLVAKTASGAVEHVDQIFVTNISRTLEQLKESNFWIYGLDETGRTTLPQNKFDGRTVFVMGREGKGIRPLVKKNCDALIQLPTSDVFSTLNVSNAAAVTFYEWKRQNG